MPEWQDSLPIETRSRVGAESGYRRRVEVVLQRAVAMVPGESGRVLGLLLTGEVFATAVGTLVLWGASHVYGVGELVDAVLLTVGFVGVGAGVVDGASEILLALNQTHRAKSDEDLTIAAGHLAKGLVQLGVVSAVGFLARGSAKKILGRDLNAKFARKPDIWIGKRTASGPPTVSYVKPQPSSNGPTILGWCNWWGDVYISLGLSAHVTKLTRVHELVHSVLRPKVRIFRTFRAQMAANGYYRTKLLQAVEEMLAETVAQLKVNGLGGVPTGLRFPIVEGYVTAHELILEGYQIGTVVVGSVTFHVGIVQLFSQESSQP